MKKASADWTPEVVARLWDYHAESLGESYFSRQVGRGIVNFLESTGSLRGEVLDYGCGPGDLIELLLGRGLSCSAIEFSADSIDVVNERFEGRSNWKGATLVSGLPSPLPPQSFDVVLCVEVIEHLSDDLLRPVLGEVRRLLRPGGIALLTTPNEERLQENAVYCPFCDSEFHRYGHLQTFSASSLRELLGECGLEPLFCEGVHFEAWQEGSPLNRFAPLPRAADWSPRLLFRRAASSGALWLDRLAPRPFPQGRELRRRAVPGPHLCAVARVAA